MTDKYRNTPKGRIAPNGYRLCDPLSVGEVLPDFQKNEWVIGKPIGCGGFGEIYLCHEKKDPSKTYVMKLDNLNGPIFVEINFTIRACKKTMIKAFMTNRKLAFLGIPDFIASGTTNKDSKNGGYRYLVMERLGDELQKVLEKTRLSIGLVCRIASRIIDALEYIHEQGYIHADIKAQNILRAVVTDDSKKRSSKKALDDADDELKDDDKYYLIDYGLVERYTYQSAHKPYEFDKRTANNGTCEFRSRDAHIGVISRRSDIESLGYNIILWFYGRHPWAGLLKNADKVLDKKTWAMKNIEAFLKEAFSDKPLDDSDTKPTPNKSKAAAKKNIPAISTSPPKGLNKFFEEVNSLAHDEMPNYNKLKQILNNIAILNSDEPIATSNGNKKKANSTASSAKKTISSRSNKRKSDLTDFDMPDSTPPVKNKRTQSTKVPLKSKSNHVLVNGSTNGAIDLSDDETEEDSLEQLKETAKSKAKLKNSRTKKTLTSKRKSLSISLKKQKSSKLKNDKPKSRTLRNRIKSEDEIDLSDDDDSLLNAAANYPNGNQGKTPKRKVPRLSTPLIMMTPPEGGESPIFGHFEPDDSIKENQNVPNGNSRSNNVSSHQEEVEGDTEAMRELRMYINNKRCSSKKSSRSTSTRPEISVCSDSSVTSVETDDIKPALVNGKLDKARHSISSKSKISRSNGIHKLNGKAKTNGHIASSVASSASSSKSVSTTRKRRQAKALYDPEEFSTITPESKKSVKSSPVIENTYMQKIRAAIEKRRNAPLVATNKK